MNQAIKKGFSFGLTSGIITTLGIVIGLGLGTNSKLVVLGGILTIGLADALSDALGIHISEESNTKLTDKKIWQATIATFVSKLFFALTFAPAVLFLNLNHAIIFDIVWGLLLLTGFSYYLAETKKQKPFKIIFEHLSIAVIVIIATNLIGRWINTW